MSVFSRETDDANRRFIDAAMRRKRYDHQDEANMGFAINEVLQDFPLPWRIYGNSVLDANDQLVLITYASSNPALVALEILVRAVNSSVGAVKA